MHGLLLDLRWAARRLMRRPHFTAIAVAMLGVGIGACAGVFMLVDALLLRPLDIREPERFISLTNTRPDVSHPIPFSYAMWEALRDRQSSLEGLFAWAYPALTVEIDGARERAGGFVVAGSAFDVLGVGPALGRTFSTGDDGQPVAVLSHDFWTRRFGADPEVIGETVRVSWQPYTVVGVAEKGFVCLQPGVPCEVIIPLESYISGRQSVDWRARRLLWLEIHGRLRPGVSIEAARSELEVLWPGILESTIPLDARGDRETRFRSQTVGVQSAARGSSRYQGTFANPLFVLAMTVGLLLLIISFNIASLILAHAASTGRETAVRIAIGAGRARILRISAFESLLVVAAGAALGFGLSLIASRALLAFWDSGPGRIALDLRTDLRLFAFIVSAALLSALVAGLVPALRAASTAPDPRIRAADGRSAGGRSRVGAVLLSAQIAFSLCSLSVAVLLGRTLSNLRDQPRDFVQEGVVTFSLAPVADSYGDRDLYAYYQQLLAEIEAIPGVEAAALTDNAPLEVWPTPFEVGAASPNAAEGVTATSGCVSPGLFPALRTPLLAGRLFEASDRTGSEGVAIVNQALARDLFGQDSPLGQRIGFGLEPGVYDRRVVGVIQDRGYRGFRRSDVPAVYVPCEQRGLVWAEGFLKLVVRAEGLGSDVVASVSQRIEALGVEFPVGITILRMRAERALVRERALATVSTAIALIALVLAGIGMFSLAAYTVRNERRSIGVRMAVGADRRKILAWVLERTVRVAVAGIAVGLPLSILAGRFLESMLFGVSSADPWTLAGAGTALGAISVLAALAGALQASFVQPMTVLRED